MKNDHLTDLQKVNGTSSLPGCFENFSSASTFCCHLFEHFVKQVH